MKLDPNRIVLTEDKDEDQSIIGQAVDIADQGVDYFFDASKGFISGGLGIPQGILETIGAGFDATFNQNSKKGMRRLVTDTFNSIRETTGAQPEGAVGKVVEGLTTFGATLIPVIGFVNRASLVARGANVVPATSKFMKAAEKFGKSSYGKQLTDTRFKQALTTSFAGGAAEGIVAPEGTRTLSDAFDVLPKTLVTEEDMGLSAGEDALRVLKNKFKIGVEGATLGLGVEAAIPVVGAATKVAAEVPGIPTIARIVKNLYGGAGKILNKSKFIRENLTSTGGLDKRVFENLSDLKARIETQTNLIANRFGDFEKAAKKLKGHVKNEQIYADLLRYLEGDEKVFDIRKRSGLPFSGKFYTKEVKQMADDMRVQVDGLSDIIFKNLEDGVQEGTVSPDLVVPILEEMTKERGKYFRRLYANAFSSDPKLLAKMKKDKRYTKAVQKSASQIRQLDPSVGQNEAIIQATEVVDKAIVGDIKGSSLDPETLLKLRDKETKGQNLKEVPLYTISEGLLKKRSEFLNKNPDLRALMGEIRDPKYLVTQTVTDLSKFISVNQFYKTMALPLDQGGFKETFTEAVPKINNWVQGKESARPLIISGKNLNADQISDLQIAGYKKLGERVPQKSAVIDDLKAQNAEIELAEAQARASGEPLSAAQSRANKELLDNNKKLIKEELDKLSVTGGNYGSLSGDFVAPEIYNALTVSTREGGFVSELWALALQGKGLSQIAKTVLNPLAQIRNFLSGIFMVGANGNIVRETEFLESMKMTYGKVSDLSTTESKEFFEMIGDLGLREENVVLNEYQQLIKEGAGTKTNIIPAGKTSALIDYGMKKVPLVMPLQRLYANTDTYWKTVGFVGEKSKYTSAFRKSGLDPDNIGDDITKELINSGIVPRSSDLMGKHGFLNVLASDIVKETMPIYSRVPSAVKSLRRVPIFGNFAAFPAEIIRNTSNILDRSLKELSFKAKPSLVQKIGRDNAKELQKQIRAIGANRLTSYINMAFTIPMGVTKIALSSIDMSDEKLASLRKLMPEFLQGHQTVPLLNPKKGEKMPYIDLSYMMPYDFVLAPARKAMEIYAKKGELNNSETEKITAGTWAAFQSLIEPFAGESLIAERVLDALPINYLGRGGKTSTGAPVWNPTDDTGTAVSKGVNHVLGGLIPGGVEQFARLTPRGFEQGRTAKAITKDPTAAGIEYDVREEILTAFTGVRKLELDIPKSLSYKGYEYTSDRASAGSLFKQEAKRNDSTRESILQSYVQANENLFKVQRKLMDFINSARDGGMSERDILISLKKFSNLGSKELKSIVQNKFLPIAPTKELIDSIRLETEFRGERRVTPQIPLDEIVNLYRGFFGRSLLSGSLVEPRRPDIDTSRIVAPSPQTSFTFDANRVVSPQTQNTQTVDPGLLGNNPSNVLKNLQIRSRTQ